ncbi:DUF5313 family protein [Tsukamurella sp. 8F]|uniref:DUF5313 family protein n=1 Tax=unclassified Tsukamurella TaxID=2633480 RepID=UPI0023B9957C|nr:MULTISPECIES: DUF5313 family protein [unclassified Tsukamurella]MDF0531504.1 DUF5313 family protein [Tsukamurella sp. 8J]MDF0588748.1 DUF5313 family protein [Tsukamurella sp. 8F]
MPAMRAPGPAHYIAFVYGASLPERNREWVRHTLTCDTWVARFVVRGQLAVAPVYAALLALPGPLGLRLATVLLGALLVGFYNVAYMRQNRAQRLQQNGLDRGLENPRVLADRAAIRLAYEAAHPRTE